MLGTGKKKTSVKDIRIFDESKICKGRGDILGARVLLCSWTLEKLPGFRSSVSGWPELCLRTQGSRWKISKGRNPGVGFWRPGPDTELLARGFFSDIGVLRLRDSGHHGALSSRLSPGELEAGRGGRNTYRSTVATSAGGIHISETNKGRKNKHSDLTGYLVC